MTLPAVSHRTTPPLSVVITAGDVLDASAGRLASRTPDRRPFSTEWTAQVQAVTRQVRDRMQHPDLESEPTGLGDTEVVDILDRLEEDVLAHATDRSACPSIQVLRAIHASRPGNARNLRDRLSGADAFDLVIEIAHDFRSPLTSILLLAETLRDGQSGAVTDLQRSQLGLIYGAAFGLAAIASDIVELARHGRGLVDDDPQPFSLREVVDGVVRLVAPIAEEKRLEVRVLVPEVVHVRGHSYALSRVLLNLVTNALKFTDSGYVEIGVRQLPRARLGFHVRDTGRGIPLERRAELFEPFKKRHSDGRAGHFFSGSGVGLSIACRLVAAMGSELVLESSDETGTCFSFILAASSRTDRASLEE